MKRSRDRIPAEYEAETRKGSGQIRGLRLGSLFIEVSASGIPEKGEGQYEIANPAKSLRQQVLGDPSERLWDPQVMRRK